MEKTGKSLMMFGFAERQVENRRRQIAMSAAMEAKANWQQDIDALRDGEPTWNDIERAITRVAEYAAYLAAEQTDKHIQGDVDMVQQFVDSKLTLATLTPPEPQRLPE